MFSVEYPKTEAELQALLTVIEAKTGEYSKEYMTQGIASGAFRVFADKEGNEYTAIDVYAVIPNPFGGQKAVALLRHGERSEIYKVSVDASLKAFGVID